MTDLHAMFTGTMTLSASERESLAELVRSLLDADAAEPETITTIVVSPDFRAVLATVLLVGTSAIDEGGVECRFTAGGGTR